MGLGLKVWLEILNAVEIDIKEREVDVVEKIRVELKRKDESTYKEWQDSRFDIDFMFEGHSLLHMAAQSGHTETIRALIGKRADFNAKNKLFRRTPLLLAAREGNEDAVYILMEAGADPSLSDIFGDTVFNVELFMGKSSVEIEQWKKIFDEIKNKDDIVYKIMEGLKVENLGAYREWEKFKFHVDYKFLVDQKYNATLFSVAAQADSAGVVDALISNGSNVNIESDYSTPLVSAIRCGNLHMVKALIKARASLNSRGSGMFTGLPLVEAIECGNADIVEALIEAGADVNKKLDTLNYPLSRAAKKGNEDVVKLLIEAGANVDSVDHERVATPLHYAVRHMHIGAMRALIRGG